MYLLLFVLWLILNAKITLEICLFGIGVVVLTGVVCYALFGYTPKKELRLYTKLPLFFAYIAVLVWEILKANINVLRIVLRRRPDISPALVSFDVDLHSEFARYILANSITLTPGTITVDMEGSRFTAHCLDAKLLEGVENCMFVRLLKKLEA